LEVVDMSLAMLVVTGVRLEGRKVAEVARDYDVSRQWIYTLLSRYDAEGEAGLQPRSRRPHGNARATPSEVEQRIVELRKQLVDDGLDAGAHTIAWHLERELDRVPAPATIWRILVRRGFVTPEPHKRPKSSYIRFVAEQPNKRWQADPTHWTLADDTDVEILNILDDHSRLLVGSRAHPTVTGGDVVDDFQTGFERYGLPATVLTDNGAVFTGKPRGLGQVAFEKLLAGLNIELRHSRAYHPQTCGKVERFHQTLKKWLNAHDPATDLDDLQSQLDTFTEIYNHHRPHRAIGRRTPAEAFAARPKATPPTGGTVPVHYRIRRDLVNNGTVTLRHNSRLHHIGIGKAHTGRRVLLLIDELHIRIITDDGQLLRELTLDPTRDYQPRGVRPGPQPHQT
jgi:transposase InsO family protein